MTILSLRGISQADLARKAGVSEGVITKLKNSERQPKLHIVQKIAGALEVTIDLLAGAKGNDPITRELLAAESLELFCRVHRISTPLRREFEDLILAKMPPATDLAQWRTQVDIRRFSIGAQFHEPSPNNNPGVKRNK